MRSFALHGQREEGATSRRKGDVSVSVDPRTKEALRALANRDFGGNLSALVTDLAEEARRRMAADAYLQRRLESPTSCDNAFAKIALSPLSPTRRCTIRALRTRPPYGAQSCGPLQADPR